MPGLTRYNRYPRDYLSGTRTLSLEAKGVYNDLIDTIYDTGRPIPYDMTYLCRLCGVRDKRTLMKPLNELMAADKIRLVDGVLINDRAMAELEEATRHIENGRQGGRPPKQADAVETRHSSPAVSPSASELHADCNQTHDAAFVEDQDLSENPPTPTPTPRPIEEEGRGARADGDVADGPLLDLVPEAVTLGPLEPATAAKPPEKPSPSTRKPWLQIIKVFDAVRIQVFGSDMARPNPAALDQTYATRWLEMGADEELCRAVFLDRCTRAKRDGVGPPDTLKYCNNAVERAVIQRRNVGNTPAEGSVHNGKSGFGVGPGHISPQAGLFAAAATVSARRRQKESCG
ncbi:DUF1376 domain-containing protein [Azospirillum sp. TSA6c]|uniref:DUF1376 domain-containing protein n=1 Tax=Azospirillum sp. TSA6c TaxID=709813 RepID=UPI000D64C0C1|nr:DUF1376 domain-containing protein [Azospirillum sp. TSA6c]